MNLPERKMITQYWPYTQPFLEFHNPDSMPAKPRCRGYIVLDGMLYRCRRIVHEQGAHDAQAKHTDGGLVRW